MSHTNRNFVIAYAFLVVLPLVGLAGVLRAGRTVKAPVFVGGTWNLRVDAAQLDSLPCGKTLAASFEKAILVSQSGKTFELSFPNGPRVAASGTLDGTTLRASLTPAKEWSAETGCGPGQQLSLVATIDSQAKPKSMTGKLSVDDCASCSPVDLFASQQAVPPSKETH